MRIILHVFTAFVMVFFIGALYVAPGAFFITVPIAAFFGLVIWLFHREVTQNRKLAVDKAASLLQLDKLKKEGVNVYSEHAEPVTEAEIDFVKQRFKKFLHRKDIKEKIQKISSKTIITGYVTDYLDVQDTDGFLSLCISGDKKITMPLSWRNYCYIGDKIEAHIIEGFHPGMVLQLKRVEGKSLEIGKPA